MVNLTVSEDAVANFGASDGSPFFQELVMQVRGVLWIEQYRAPHLPSPDAGANPGPDPLRQGANFADMTCCGINTRTIGGDSVNDGVMFCPSLRLRFPVRLIRATCAKRQVFPELCLLARRVTASGFSRQRVAVGKRQPSGRSSINRLLRHACLVVTNTPQLVFRFVCCV